MSEKPINKKKLEKKNWLVQRNEELIVMLNKIAVDTRERREKARKESDRFYEEFARKQAEIRRLGEETRRMLDIAKEEQKKKKDDDKGTPNT